MNILDFMEEMGVYLVPCAQNGRPIIPYTHATNNPKIFRSWQKRMNFLPAIVVGKKFDTALISSDFTFLNTFTSSVYFKTLKHIHYIYKSPIIEIDNTLMFDNKNIDIFTENQHILINLESWQGKFHNRPVFPFMDNV